MSRILTTATTMAGLWLATLTLSASPASGQGITLNLPPIGGLGQSGLDRLLGPQQWAPGADWSRGGFPTSAHRHPSNLPGQWGSLNLPGGISITPTVPGAAPGFGAPGFNTPGFNTPGFNTPGFGTPGLGAPGFGAPGFHTPGFGAPGHHHHAPGGAWYPPQGVGPAVGVVDQLIGEVGAFLQAFGPTVHVVPQGQWMYQDAYDLYQGAVALRQAALAGTPPQELRRIHAQMDRSAASLVNRVNRVARGRTGPNIEHVRYISSLSQQVRAYL